MSSKGEEHGYRILLISKEIGSSAQRLRDSKDLQDGVKPRLTLALLPPILPSYRWFLVP
jgi:hypothetical protein